ncbi:hypothetical protein [Bosea sp. CRIB-10]|uniref:hypothetical protein n=1 Tax=Bosea sp. CRIB-10 TaxID=378404 RepID=UPI00111383FE|nr:hypothetical protein [Bosea sp. CRIB-10]
MIKTILNSVATAWMARDAERGDLPEGMSVPLTLLAARLPAPILVVGAIGYGLYQLNMETRARRAKDVTPKRRPTAPRKPSGRDRRGSRDKPRS